MQNSPVADFGLVPLDTIRTLGALSFCPFISNLTRERVVGGKIGWRVSVCSSAEVKLELITRTFLGSEGEKKEATPK